MTIGNNVTSIGDYAFFDCTGLINVIIEDGWKFLNLGSNVFYGCPISKLYLGRSLSSYSFRDIETLTDVTIGNSVTSIGDSAFSGCTGLSEISIPGSVTSIGDRAFSGCTGLTEISIPGSVKSIGDYAFQDCSLSNVVIEDGEQAIWFGYYSFYGCPITKLYLGRSLGSSPFKDIKTLIDVIIGNNVTSIGNSAFNGCTGLTEMSIPNSVTSIGDSAFQGCTGLTEISIPGSVTSIGNSAFAGCTGLAKISIPNGATSIGDYAFYGCTGLTEISIPNGVTGIGDYAFYNCACLTEISINNGATNIGGHAFFGCYNLRSVSISNSVTSIEDSAFERCHSLTSVAIPNSVTSIGSAVFQDCSDLTSVTIGNSVEGIGDNAFTYCYRLTSIVIPASVQSIGEQAFLNCESLKAIYSPGYTPATLVNRTFENVNNESCVLYVPDGAYDNYSNAYGWKDFVDIREVLYINKDGVTYIAKDGLEPRAEIIAAEPALEELCINITVSPDAASARNAADYVVTSIAENAFKSCMNLKRLIVMSATPIECKGDCFNATTYENCELVVPDGAIDAYAVADGWKNFRNIKSSFVQMVTDSNSDAIMIANRVITAREDTSLIVYSLDGLKLIDRFLYTGESLRLDYGFYIVVCNGRSTKIIVN